MSIYGRGNDGPNVMAEGAGQWTSSGTPKGETYNNGYGRRKREEKKKNHKVTVDKDINTGKTNVKYETSITGGGVGGKFSNPTGGGIDGNLSNPYDDDIVLVENPDGSFSAKRRGQENTYDNISAGIGTGKKSDDTYNKETKTYEKTEGSSTNSNQNEPSAPYMSDRELARIMGLEVNEHNSLGFQTPKESTFDVGRTTMPDSLDQFIYFNVNRLPNFDDAPNAYNYHLFFVRPQLNIIPYEIENQKKSFVGKLSDFLVNKFYDPKTMVDGLSAIYDNDKSLFARCLTNGAFGPFIPFMTMRAKGLRIDGRSLRSIEMGETFYGQTISYGGASFEHLKGVNIDIEFENDRYLSVYNTVSIWRDYIQKISQDITWHPNMHHIITNPILDYGGALFYIVTEPNNYDIVFWKKYYGIFPISVPDEMFSSSGDKIFEKTFTVTFRASAVGEPCDINDLYSFNLISRRVEHLFGSKEYEFFTSNDPSVKNNLNVFKPYYPTKRGMVMEHGEYGLAKTPLIVKRSNRTGKFALLWTEPKLERRKYKNESDIQTKDDNKHESKKQSDEYSKTDDSKKKEHATNTNGTTIPDQSTGNPYEGSPAGGGESNTEKKNNTMANTLGKSLKKAAVERYNPKFAYSRDLSSRSHKERMRENFSKDVYLLDPDKDSALTRKRPAEVIRSLSQIQKETHSKNPILLEDQHPFKNDVRVGFSPVVDPHKKHNADSLRPVHTKEEKYKVNVTSRHTLIPTVTIPIPPAKTTVSSVIQTVKNQLKANVPNSSSRKKGFSGGHGTSLK